jgi:hypothetical protein
LCAQVHPDTVALFLPFGKRQMCVTVLFLRFNKSVFLNEKESHA